MSAAGSLPTVALRRPTLRSLCCLLFRALGTGSGPVAVSFPAASAFNSRRLQSGRKETSVHKALSKETLPMYGNLSGVRGDLTGVLGNLDDCDLSPADRAAGVDVQALIV